MKPGSTVAVVIPAFNEEESIGAVLSSIPAEVEGYPVRPVVVVDGATDDTEGAARRAGHEAIALPANRGQGYALRAGFSAAMSSEDEVVVTMDADGQHRPDQLAQLLKPIIAGDADFVQGSRFLGAYDDSGAPRELGIKLFSSIIGRLTGTRLTDVANGYRAIRVDKLATLRLEEDRYSAPELLMEATHHGLRITEVPVHVQSRSHGFSKKPRGLSYPLRFLWVIVRVWWRQRLARRR